MQLGLSYECILSWAQAPSKYLNDNVIPEFERKFNADVGIDMATWNNRMEKLLITTAGAFRRMSI